MCCKSDVSVVSAVFLTPKASPSLWVGVMLVGLCGRACHTSACMVPTCQSIVLSRAEVNIGPLHMLLCCRAESSPFSVEANISSDCLLFYFILANGVRLK